MDSAAQGETTLSKRGVVYKSNKLIEGRYVLSAVAQKIAAAVISRVDPRPSKSGDPLPQFVLSMAELCEIAGISRPVLYRKIRSYTKELKSIVVEVEREDRKEGYKQLGLFREFDFDGSNMTLNIEFEGRIEEHIRDFAGNFTKYQLVQLSGLVSRYSIRLYELLRKSHNMGKTEKSVSFYQKSVEDLRLILGVEPKKYSNRFDLFRVNVIDRAQKELKDKTDLQFDYEKIKLGRRVVAIKFFIRSNAQFEALGKPGIPEPAVILPDDFDEGLFSMLKVVVPDIPDQDAILMVTGYDKNMLTEALMDLSRATRDTVIENKHSYLTGILKAKRLEESDKSRRSPTKEEENSTSWASGGMFDDSEWDEK